DRNRAKLNGSRISVAGGLNAAENRVGELECFERHEGMVREVFEWRTRRATPASRAMHDMRASYRAKIPQGWGIGKQKGRSPKGAPSLENQIVGTIRLVAALAAIAAATTTEA